MGGNRVHGMLAAAVLMAAAGDAYAATVNVDCSSNSGALAAQFSGATPGGTANTTYVIAGPCDGNFEITQSNITVKATSGTSSITGGPAVGIRGASNIILQDLNMVGDRLHGRPMAVNITGPASVIITSRLGLSMIENAEWGVAIVGPASVSIEGTTIQNTGSDDSGSATGGGVFARGLSSVALSATTIQMNKGIGIDAFDGSTIELANVTGGVSSGPSSPAIRVRHSSSVFLNGAGGLPTIVTGPAGNHTILASQGSSVTLQDAIVTADTPFDANNQFAVITATDSSSVLLAGGNFITNSAPGGAAVMVSGGSSFKVSNATDFFGDYAGLGDTINGRGLIHTQSVIELGASPNGRGIDWTGDILVNQGSSFRADGDFVTINGTLTLDQAANGYFNHQAGIGSGITKVVCQSTTDHVSNPTLVFPNIKIGPPPGCALF